MSYFIPSPAETTYSSAFPPLQSIPWSFNHKVNSMHHSMNPIITPLAPPKYPTYLKHTSYADLVTEQYDDSKRRRNTTTTTTTKEVEELDLRLPQFWHKSIKSSQLEIGSNGYDLTYITGLLFVVCVCVCVCIVRGNYSNAVYIGVIFFRAR